jgi:hypothetical protein
VPDALVEQAAHRGAADARERARRLEHAEHGPLALAVAAPRDERRQARVDQRAAERDDAHGRVQRGDAEPRRGGDAREPGRLDEDAREDQRALADRPGERAEQPALDRDQDEADQPEHVAGRGRVHPERVLGEEPEGLLEAGEREDHDEVDEEGGADAAEAERGAEAGRVERGNGADVLAAVLRRERLREKTEREQEVQEREPRRGVRGEGAGPAERVHGLEGAADHRAKDESEADPRADEPHPLRALLARGDVRDVGLGDRDVAGGDAAPEAGGEQQPQRGGVREDQHADGRGGDARDEDRAAAGAVAEVPPERDEEELHQRVRRAEERGGEARRAELPGDARQVRHNQPEAEQVEEDRQEDRAEGGLAHDRGRRL